MPANTSPDNIEYPVSTDPVAPLETVFANMANSVQDAFDGFRIDWNDFEDNHAIQTFRWADASERSSQTGMVAGDIGYQVDTGVQYRYTGSAWLDSRGDMPLQTKTGTSVTSLSLDAIPNASAYAYFRFVVNLTARSASSKIGMRLRAGGVDNTSAVYDFYATSPQTSTQWSDLASAAAGPCSIQGTIYDLSKNSPTRITSQSTGAALSDGTGINMTTLGGQHRTAAAFDSFTILAASGTFTGTVSVWGMLS